jgi:beta-lysine N6-acetyltransferase
MTMVPDRTAALDYDAADEVIIEGENLPEYGETKRIRGNGYEYEAFFSTRNGRLRVVRYMASDLAKMVHSLKIHALQQQAGKIFLKSPMVDVAPLKLLGFQQEAVIKGYLNGNDAAVLSFFPDVRRTVPMPDEEARRQIVVAASSAPPAESRVLPAGFSCRIAGSRDAGALAAVFASCFNTYPFPVFDPNYILKSMQNDVVYMLILRGDQPAAIASAETVPELGNAEMTDFATLPDFRGIGLGSILLRALEREMAHRDIPNLYTLARASAVSMNRIFGRAGYQYTGTLVRNCHISGDFEDMNCWCKQLSYCNFG